MAHKKALTDAELEGLFEGITDSTATPSGASTSSKPASAPKPPPPAAAASAEDDPLAELESLAKAKPASRPHTPKQSGLTASRSRPVTVEAATPSSTGSTRTSEDRNAPGVTGRKSGESSRSYHQAFTPASTSEGSPNEDLERERREREAQKQQEQQAGGGWWGGLWSTASAVRKQAEAAVKEIRSNEEAQKWVEGAMKGKLDVNALKGLGADLRTRALPTFTSLLHTLAPPISQHERLLIHTTHDLLNYPSLDPTIFAVFSRVMSQVEGGDLMVIQRGSESTPRRSSSEGYRGPGLNMSTSGGWNDGPWWRQGEAKRDIGIVKGLAEGSKLAKVGAETYATEYFAGKGGVEEAAKQATQVLSESNPVRSSDIFLALQAVSYTQPAELFASSSSSSQEQKEGGVEEQPDQPDELVTFAVYLYDPVHALSFSTLSQSFPVRWIEWLDAPAAQHPDFPNEYRPPEDIAQIIDEGGVDPREWVAEWVEESLSMAVGVLAQRYVARRMGVGEGGLGRGKAREEAVMAGAGEVARAMGGL
ncbi:hypothetical protein NA57DRAFT_47540 [Rhizodiscina lignyota]|uniref:Maintenance of telomere capping protein 1 n=1 Tax=Rhizodiscina lignyota TaxID=1504668 RepID=A0A9P4I6D5_9PEZI|nr:hypothetical protein NA57DRAFT_47540 [Rhizodiscina lignyota]